MPIYDNPMTCMYNFPVMDFGAASGTTIHRIAGPTGKVGRLREVGVVTSEVFYWETTAGIVQVGLSTDADAYAQLNIASATAANTVFNTADDTDAIIARNIPADTAILVTLTEVTGGAITGQGNPYVIIDWF